MTWESKTLTGKLVELQPLQPDHFDALWAVADHGEIWAYMPFAASEQASFNTYLEHLLAQQQAGTALPFATVHKSSNALVGSSCYLAMDEHNKRLEIGATWITPAMQRTGVNTEVKFLQLAYAFEQLGCNRVEFKTDSLNQRSRQALARIGAKEEGTFRNHMVMPDGRIRHSVWFSITKEEWPAVREQLVSRMR